MNAPGSEPIRGQSGTGPNAGQPSADGAAAERVPLFGTWRRAYLVVIAALMVDILLLYACTRLLA